MLRNRPRVRVVRVDDTDRIGDALRDDDAGWGLALDDHYRWAA